MSKKRDLPKEIQAKKERAELNNDASLKLFFISHNFERRAEPKKSFDHENGLFVVGIVACIEVAVRDAIQKLIDHGRPYVERISEFKDTLHLDFNIAIALHDKRISFGDLVAHLLPVSNVAQINSHFEVLLGRKFKQVLADIREFVEPLDREIQDSQAETDPELDDEGDPPLLPITDVDALIASLGRLFRARHNAAHEAVFDSVTDDELRDFFKAGEMFIHALDETVRQTLEPNMPRSAMGASMAAVEESGQVYDEMQALYEKASGLATDVRDEFAGPDELTQSEALKAAQEAFEKYFDAEMAARGVYSSKLAGTGMRMRDAHVQKELCAHRIQMLNELIDDLEFQNEISSLKED